MPGPGSKLEARPSPTMKFTFQTAILLVVVSLVHVAVISQFLPKQPGAPATGSSAPEGMIGPQEIIPATSSEDSPNSDLNPKTETEAPDLADLVKDAAASFSEFEGPEGPSGEPVATENTEASGASLVNPEAKTVLARMPPEQPANATEEAALESVKSGSQAPSPEHSDPVAQVRPQSEPAPSSPKSAAADALKVRLISPLP